MEKINLLDELETTINRRTRQHGITRQALDIIEGLEGLRHRFRGAAVHQIDSSLAIGAVKRCILDVRLVLCTLLFCMI